MMTNISKTECWSCAVCTALQALPQLLQVLSVPIELLLNLQNGWDRNIVAEEIVKAHDALHISCILHSQEGLMSPRKCTIYLTDWSAHKIR